MAGESYPQTADNSSDSDEFGAIWVSYSSIRDFLKCPRAYYLKNIFKDPRTERKIQIVSPSLSLGQVVHRVLESLSFLPRQKRFDKPLPDRFEEEWQKISGEKGGFESAEEEREYKKRGREMVERVARKPGPLKQLAVKIKDDLPHFWLSSEDRIILCGRIDWLEYLPEKKAVHIIDFKTGRGNEEKDSLQLPIYCLLAQECQSYPVAKVSYWYLDRADQPNEMDLPDINKAREKILKIAKKIKLARQLDRFPCPNGDSGCRYCRPWERVARGEGKLVGINDFGQSIYFLKKRGVEKEGEREVIL